MALQPVNCRGRRGGLGRSRLGTAFAAVASVSALVLSGCGGGSSGGSGHASGSASPIKIGLIIDLTGATGPDTADALHSVKARVAEANAEGGIDGHPIKLIYLDAASDPKKALSASQQLVEQDHVVGIVGMTSTDPAIIPYLYKQHIALVERNTGGSIGIQPYTNAFGNVGSANPKNPYSPTLGKFLKSQGVTSLAALGWGAYPTSVTVARAGAKSAEDAGIKAPYINTSIDATATNYSTYVTAMKKAGVDAVFTGMGQTANVAIMKSAQQQGLKFKAAMFPVGFDGATLKDPTTTSGAEGAMFWVPFVPAVFDTPATANFVKWLHKESPDTYAGSVTEHGWLSTDLLLAGVKAAGGGSATSTGVIEAITNMHAYDGGGLEIRPVTFSLDYFGKGASTFGQYPGYCVYVVQLSGGKFVPVQKLGEPVCADS